MKKIFAAVIGLLATCALLMAVGHGASATEPSAQERPPVGATPADYFRALYFGMGPVADSIPLVRDAAASRNASSSQAAAAQDQLVATINANSPGFLEQFATEVTSGEHFRISEALNNGTEELRKAIEGTDPNAAAAMADPSPKGKACSVTLACAVTVAVAYNYVGGVNVAVAVMVYVKVAGPSGTETEDGLLERQVVQQAADNLSR
jgi:SdpC family antimicrobial peptide